MSWLLYVNALVALAHQGHADHRRMISWYASLIDSGETIKTCSITEIGFVRVSIQAGFERNAPDAVETLTGLKQSSQILFQFISDPLEADGLPDYVLGSKQVTDGHLLALAQDSSMQLATLDKAIPRAYCIP